MSTRFTSLITGVIEQIVVRLFVWLIKKNDKKKPTFSVASNSNILN